MLSNNNFLYDKHRKKEGPLKGKSILQVSGRTVGSAARLDPEDEVVDALLLLCTSDGSKV